MKEGGGVEKYLCYVHYTYNLFIAFTSLHKPTGITKKIMVKGKVLGNDDCCQKERKRERERERELYLREEHGVWRGFAQNS